METASLCESMCVRGARFVSFGEVESGVYLWELRASNRFPEGPGLLSKICLCSKIFGQPPAGQCASLGS